MTLIELFHKFNGIINVSGCWIPYNYLPNQDGYIRVKWNGKCVYLHRLSFCLENDLDYNDKSFQVNHKPNCHNTICFNPSHLYKGDHQDNMIDRTKRITHCSKGHEYNENNPKHHKGCRLCLRISNEKAKQLRRTKHANSR